MGIKEILQKLYSKKDFPNDENPKFNKIPEDLELAHYQEMDRRENIKNIVREERLKRNLLNIQETKFKGHSMFNQDGNVIPKGAIAQALKDTDEEAYNKLYSQDNNVKTYSKGGKTFYKSKETGLNIKSSSKNQIKNLVKELQKLRKVQLNQINRRAKIDSRLSNLTLPKGLQRIKPASGIPRDIGKPIINDSSILKSNVVFSEPTEIVPVTGSSSSILSNSSFFQSSPRNNSLFWKF